jgi:SAM-dependent methyltransferase
MKDPGRYDGVLRYVAAYWPTYLILYGGGAAVTLLVVVVSAPMGWWAFVSLGLAALLLLVYFWGASLWAAHKMYDQESPPDYDVLFGLSQLGAGDTFLLISLGLRHTAVNLARHLTSGRLIVVDLYNPQLTPDRALRRWRAQNSRAFKQDPRIIWRDGRLDLLPVPDNSMPAVMVSQTAAAFWQQGDRHCLLREIYRVLAPGGRLLLSERVRSQTNLAVMGPAVLQLDTAVYWRRLLQEAGFEIRKEQALHGLVHCFRADKPVSERARQLHLDF